jgi:Ulp1 family protease
LKLRKWTKGMNIFEKDYLFVPIHNSYTLTLSCKINKAFLNLFYVNCVPYACFEEGCAKWVLACKFIKIYLKMFLVFLAPCNCKVIMYHVQPVLVQCRLHWSLAIICFPGADAHLQSSSECCIIHLDSLITGGHKSQGVFNCLRR